MGQTSHPKRRAQLDRQLNLGTAQNQGSQQSTMIGTRRGLQTLGDGPADVGQGRPGPIQHHNAGGPQLTPTAPGCEPFRRTGQQWMQPG